MRSARDRWFAVGAVALVGVLTASLFWLVTLLRGKGLDWADKFSSVAAFFLTAGALLVSLLGHVVGWLRPRLIDEEAIRRAKSDLAGSLDALWTEEQSHQPLRRVPMQVRWEVTPDAEAVMLGVPPSAVTGGSRVAALAGEYDDIMEAFYRVPARRLVVLGPAGAGKSVLVNKLAHELLDARRPNDPVPVILQVASWNPTKRDLPHWIADQLIRIHPRLAVTGKNPAGRKVTLAQELVSGRGVLPILDGLDEMPKPLRPKAVTTINVQGPDRPLVVASRTDEYRDAVNEAARALSRALVVELLPLRVPEVKAYLIEATATPADRWRRVFERLDAEPHGPLTATLTTPLMLWLASDAYGSQKTDPGELVEKLTRTRDARALAVESDGEAAVQRMGILDPRKELERHLFGKFVATVYDPELAPVIYAQPLDRSSRQERFRCKPQQAQRWLAFLADKAWILARRDPLGTRETTRDTSDLAWWRLTLAAGAWQLIGIGIRAALLSGMAWWLAVWVLSLHGNWRAGAYVGHAQLSDLLLSGPLGQIIRPTVDGAITALNVAPNGARDVSRMLAGLLPWTNVASFAMRVGLLAAALGFLRLMLVTVTLVEIPEPKRLLVRPGKAALSALSTMALFGYLGILATALALSPAAHAAAADTQAVNTNSIWYTVLAFSLLGVPFLPSTSLVSPIDLARSSPAEALWLDRQADIVVTSLKRGVLTLTVGLYSGWQVALACGVLVVTATIVQAVLGGQRTFASRTYADARLWLTIRRRLPWRTMSFLVDAHHRDVLRQVGAVYQFRHVRLQEYLQVSWWSRWDRWKDRWEVLVDRVVEWSTPVAGRVTQWWSPIRQRVGTRLGGPPGPLIVDKVWWWWTGLAAECRAAFRSAISRLAQAAPWARRRTP